MQPVSQEPPQPPRRQRPQKPAQATFPDVADSASRSSIRKGGTEALIRDRWRPDIRQWAGITSQKLRSPNHERISILTQFTKSTDKQLFATEPLHVLINLYNVPTSIKVLRIRPP